MSGGVVDAGVPLAPKPKSASDEQWKRKLLSVLLAFVIGFLLAWFLKKCPTPGEGGGGSGTGLSMRGGGGAPGEKGGPIKVGQGGGGGGGGGGSGDLLPGDGHGKPGGGGGDADLSGGPAKGGKPAEDGPTPHVQTSPDQVIAGDALVRAANGRMGDGDAADTMPPGPPPPNFKWSQDFTYDSTSLPRYASGVTGVASGLVTDTVKHQRSTMASIVTTDSFDKVVDWYKGQVPAGWQTQKMGDMQAMAKALSPDAITKMLSGAMNGGPVDTASVTAAQNGHGTGVAIFSPPNQTKDPRSIMIMVKPGSPTQVVMSKKMQP